MTIYLKQKLHESLLHIDNINDIVDMLSQRYKLSEKSQKKCRNMIQKNIKHIYNNIDRYPSDMDELNYAVGFINDMAIEEFRDYLRSKYPHIIEKEEAVSNPIKMIRVITEKEKDAIIRQDIKRNHKPEPIRISPILLAQLIEYIQVQEKPNKKSDNAITYDKILDADDVSRLLNATITQHNQYRQNECTIFDVDTEISNSDQLINAERKIGELSTLKQKYEKENDLERMAKCSTAMKTILNNIVAYRKVISQRLKETISEGSSTAENSICTESPAAEDEGIFDLVIDPRDDYTNLTKINIDLNHDKKVIDIHLLEYQILSNPNNITRFCNTLNIFYDDDIISVEVAPGKYSIQDLLSSIQARLQPIKIYLNEDNLVEMKGEPDVDFELMTDNSPLLSVLGFTDNQEAYQDESIYTANKKYDLDSTSVSLSLSGSSSDPITLEMDTYVVLQEPLELKKVSAPIYMDHIKLNLMNQLNHCYDFMEPINIKLQVNYE